MTVAEDGGLINHGRGSEQAFNSSGQYLFARGEYDKFFLASTDEEEAIGIQLAQVASVKPSITEHVGGRSFIVRVTEHDTWAAGQDFAVVGNANFDIWKWRSDGAKAVAGRRGKCDHGRGFGQAVAGQNGKAVVGEPLVDVG